MKRILLFSLCALGASAQYAPILTTDYPANSLATLNAKPAMTRAAGVPSGNCTQSLDLYLNTANGDLYVCSATNTWLKVTGAGGAPSAHATTHQNGGADEVATATPGANAIPKAGAAGTLAAGWIPTMNQSTSGNAATATALAATPSLCATGQAPTGILSNGNATGCAAAGGGGSGLTTMTTGAADPVASCTAPSTSNLVLYTQTTTQDIWACVATNSWKKVLSTSNTGTYVATGTTGTAPSNPASGDVTCYYSSVSLTQICLDASGNVFSAVKTTASRTANQFVTHVAATGIPATAAIVTADFPVAHKTGTKTLWLDSPVIGDSYRLIFEEGKAITLTRISCNVIGGTNAVINLMKTTEATSGSGGTPALTSDLTCTAGAVVASTAFTSAGVAARVPVALKLTTLSGTNTDLHVFVEYTVD